MTTRRATRSLIALATGLAACATPADEHEGIYVGNPSMVGLRLAAPSSAGSLDDAVLDVQALRADRCGATESLTEAIQHDLLSDTRFDLDAGGLCGMELLADGPLDLAGVRPNGRPWSVQLTVEDVHVHVHGNLDKHLDHGDDLVLELGKPGWLNAEISRAESGPIDSGAPQSQSHRELSERVWGDAYLFADHDGNGWVDDDERTGPPLGSREP